MFKRLFSRKNVDPSSTEAANRQANQGNQLLRQLRGPKQAWTKNPQFAQARRQPNPQYAQAIQGRPQQQSKYASLQQLNQQPYADVEINPETGKMQIRVPSRRQSRESGYLSMGQQQENVQPTITYSGTQQQQQAQKARKARQMQQARALYSEVKKQPRYAGIIFQGKKGQQESSTDPVYQQTLFSPQQRQQLLKKTSQQPTYMQMNPLSRRRLPQPLTGVKQAQKTLELRGIKIPESQPIYELLTSPRLAIYRDILKKYKQHKAYKDLTNSIVVKVNTLPLDESTKTAVKSMVEANMVKLMTRLDTAISDLKYIQQAGKGKPIDINSNERLVTFIRELESREFKIMTELLDYSARNCKPLTQKQKAQMKRRAFQNAKKVMRK